MFGSGDGGSHDSESGLTQVIYDLAPPIRAKGTTGQAPAQPLGWYFVVKHDGSHVQNYYLSDVHMK